MKLWMRELTVIFSNGKKKIIYGDNHKENRPDLSLDIKINKYLGSVKDNATIRISNLTYYEIVTLIEGKFTDVEIKAGYKELGSHTVFKGGVIYISNSLGDRKTNTAIILCASNLVAKYQQKNLNLSIHSGVNIYSAIKTICKHAGIRNTNISTQFKKEFLQNVTTVSGSPSNYINSLMEVNGNYFSNSDSITDSDLMMYNVAKSKGRIIPIDNKLVQLVGGYPQLSKDGLNLTISPSFGFMCGDTIEIDPSIIDISATSNTTENKMKGYYLNEDGLYIIYQMTYNLTNRSDDFSINMLCKGRKFLKGVLGGTMNE